MIVDCENNLEKKHGSGSRLNMKNVLFYITLIFYSNTFAHDQAEDYRYNHFQFKLPEYNYKAATVQVNSVTETLDNHKLVEFYGYRFSVPETFILHKESKSSLIVRDKNKNGLFFLSTNPPDFLLCGDAENEKDFCSAFDSRRDLLVKYYTLTPKDLAKKEYMGRGTRG